MLLLKDILTADILARLKKNKVSPEAILNIEKKIAELGEFHPKVGIFGKTGAGKSSLCNAVFGQDTAEVDNINACTREPKEYLIKLTRSGTGITLIDLPGIGENKDRDEEYAALYEQMIPELDLIVWVIRADDRVFSPDEMFYDNIVKNHIEKVPFLVVINQVDRINPVSKWDSSKNRPGFQQQKEIGERRQWASNQFHVKLDSVVEVSAYEKYNIGTLVEAMIDAVPNEKKLGLEKQIVPENVTEKSKNSAIRGVIEHLREFFEEIRPYIPEIINAGRSIWQLLRRTP